ncbi:hypothetical protein MBAV_005960 [Candidatus Magnetobacterium bavaricum]|uniref:Uncharacterized protein n=1 Tax=Candidatus Magnetobacterium bavaricum TaxID=29290 RepID=A0A0F3GMF2_9BACT|nr:hypothetical protein MBAV_005960 [Candidatus Magnetobacterium bavaricum]
MAIVTIPAKLTRAIAILRVRMLPTYLVSFPPVATAVPATSLVAITLIPMSVKSMKYPTMAKAKLILPNPCGPNTLARYTTTKKETPCTTTPEESRAMMFFTMRALWVIFGFGLDCCCSDSGGSASSVNLDHFLSQALKQCLHCTGEGGLIHGLKGQHHPVIAVVHYGIGADLYVPVVSDYFIEHGGDFGLVLVDVHTLKQDRRGHEHVCNDVELVSEKLRDAGKDKHVLVAYQWKFQCLVGYEFAAFGDFGHLQTFRRYLVSVSALQYGAQVWLHHNPHGKPLCNPLDSHIIVCWPQAPGGEDIIVPLRKNPDLRRYFVNLIGYDRDAADVYTPCSQSTR